MHYDKWTKRELDQVIPICIALGFTEADVRDYRYAWMADLIQVRMWNHRRVIVTGQMIYKTKYVYKPIRITGVYGT